MTFTSLSFRFPSEPGKRLAPFVYIYSTIIGCQLLISGWSPNRRQTLGAAQHFYSQFVQLSPNIQEKIFRVKKNIFLLRWLGNAQFSLFCGIKFPVICLGNILWKPGNMRFVCGAKLVFMAKTVKFPCKFPVVVCN